MSRSAKLNSESTEDLKPEVQRRLDLAAELLARIAVRIATGGDAVEQQPDIDADRQEVA